MKKIKSYLMGITGGGLNFTNICKTGFGDGRLNCSSTR